MNALEHDTILIPDASPTVPLIDSWVVVTCKLQLVANAEKKTAI